MMTIQTRSSLGDIICYEPIDIDIFLNELKPPSKIKNNKQISYYNIPAGFDIETTSFYSSLLEKVAIMYEWTLGIDNLIMVGRTWKEFELILKKLAEHLYLDNDNRLIIYVHNLSFEFQFIRKHFNWVKVFSLDPRKVCYAITDIGIEFRCSYILSNYSLAKVADNLTRHKISKMSGDLDYSKYRHSKTPLTNDEWCYCIIDVIIVIYYITECIENDGDITKIPLTKTGYVRNDCRFACMREAPSKIKSYDKYKKYRNLMDTLTLTEKDYLLCKKVFAGGFTHANSMYSRKILENIGSFDLTSAYPAVMITEKFPMSSPHHITITSKEQFSSLLENKCCMFSVKFTNIEASVFYEHYISESKCYKLENAIIDNGRVVRADFLVTSITEQDFLIIEKFYTWESMEIYNFTYFDRAYLPTDYVKTILKYYSQKTILKGVEGQEVEYLGSKEKVNSLYGMMVTDICRDEIIYDGEWNKEPVDITEAIERNNNSKNRFLYYPWGIWVTAYNRRNLFSGIYEFKDDYVYSDTDSIKAKNYENHFEYIRKYNNRIKKKLLKAMEWHKLDENLVHPKNKYGEEQWLGFWDFEKVYSKFKTIGAKRYMTEIDEDVSITVAGVNKKTAVQYLKKTYKDKIFEMFDDNLTIPKEYSGKMTHTYIDISMSGYLTDYLGNTEYFNELSSVHLENAEYSLSLSDAYIKFLLGIFETVV